MKRSILTILLAFVLFGLTLTSTSCKKCSKDRDGKTSSDDNSKTTKDSKPSPSLSSTPKSIAAMEKVIHMLSEHGKIIYRFGAMLENIHNITVKKNPSDDVKTLLNRRELEKNWPEDDVVSAVKGAHSMGDYIYGRVLSCHSDASIMKFKNEAISNKNNGQYEIVSWVSKKKLWINEIKDWIALRKDWVVEKRAKFLFEESFNGVDEHGNAVVADNSESHAKVPWCKSFELLGDNLNKLDGLMDELSKNLDDLTHAWDK